MIDNNRLKESVLDDNADIYQARKVQSERDKFSEMSFKEKIKYFNSYYRLKTIVIVIVAAFVIYMVYTIVTPKPETVLYAAVINFSLDEETAHTLQEDFGKYLDINPEKENVLIDTSIYIGGDGAASEYIYSNEQKLSTFLFTGEVDIIIAPESVFKKYAEFGYLCKLSDQLPTDLISSLANSLFISDTENNPDTSAYGIYLDGASIYDNYNEMVDKPVIGIVSNSKYKQNAVEFIRYLFQL